MHRQSGEKFFPFNLEITWALIAILSLSVGLRVFAAFYMGDKVVNLPGTYDQISYHNLALRLMDGHGFSFGTTWWPFTPADAPTAHWSFLYTFYLWFVYALFGPNALAARLIQAVIVGILHPYLVYRIGMRVFNPTIGLLAAFLTAIYIYFIYYAGALMTEPFYITAILASLFLAISIVDASHESDRRGKIIFLAVGLGLSLGAAVLLRQLFLLFVPLLLFWVGWASRKRGIKAYLPTLVIAAMMILLMIIPFTAYNYARFHRFVLLNTNAGFAFFWGNHPIYGTRFVPILTPEMGSYQSLVPEELQILDEAALDQALLKQGIQFILDDPQRYILLSLSRIPVYFMFWPSDNSIPLSNFSRVLSFGVYLPFMVYGLILGLIQQIRKNRDFFASPMALLVGFAVVYTAIHVLSWTLIRYRLPVDAVLILFAGLAVWDIVGRLGFRRSSAQDLKVIRQS